MQPDILKRHMKYDPTTGLFVWLPRTSEDFLDGLHSVKHICARWNSRYAGTHAFTSKSVRGYLQTNYLGKVITAHRAAWALMTGEIAPLIDHINGNRADNRWINLRCVSQSQNMRNANFSNRNSSGHLGISLSKNGAVWRVRLAGSEIGRFNHLSDAISARDTAAQQMGFSLRHLAKNPPAGREAAE